MLRRGRRAVSSIDTEAGRASASASASSSLRGAARRRHIVHTFDKADRTPLAVLMRLTGADFDVCIATLSGRDSIATSYQLPAAVVGSRPP